MAITKEDALDFFSDLLGTPKKETLFDTPVPKPKRFVKRWIVTNLVCIHVTHKCACCGSVVRLVNPRLLLTKVMNDPEGRIVKTVQTDCPDEADYALITESVPVEHQTLTAGTVPVCSVCIANNSTEGFKTIFKQQVDALRADSSRKKVEKETTMTPEEAEQRLMTKIESFSYEPSQTVTTNDNFFGE